MNNLVSFVRKNWGKLFTALHLYSGLRGKDVAENAPQEVKELTKGVFGSGDEVAFQRLLVKLDEKDLDVILGFIAWHFKRHNDSTVGTIIAWWQLNKWRTLITQIDSPPTKGGSEKTVIQTGNQKNMQKKGTRNSKKANQDVPSSEPSVTHTIEKDVLIGGNKSSEDLFKLIVRMVNESSDRETGYKKVVQYFEATGIPTMPSDETIEWLKGNTNILQLRKFLKLLNSLTLNLLEKLEKSVEFLQEWDENQMEKIKKRNAKRSWFSNWWKATSNLIKALTGIFLIITLIATVCLTLGIWGSQGLYVLIAVILTSIIIYIWIN